MRSPNGSGLAQHESGPRGIQSSRDETGRRSGRCRALGSGEEATGMAEEEAPGGFVRLVVSLEREHGAEGPDEEWLWAEPLGSQRYRVESSPFFAYGLSHDDIVRAEDEKEMPRIVAVERKGGHRTLRIALDGEWGLERPEIQRVLEEL